MATPPLLPRIWPSSTFPPVFQLPPGSTTPDSEKQPRIPMNHVTITAFTGEWNRSLMFESGVGRTRSKDMAKSILEAVRMNGGISFAIQKTPKITRIKLAEPRFTPLPVIPATVVVQSFTPGKVFGGVAVLLRTPPPYER